MTHATYRHPEGADRRPSRFTYWVNDDDDTHRVLEIDENGYVEAETKEDAAALEAAKTGYEKVGDGAVNPEPEDPEPEEDEDVLEGTVSEVTSRIKTYEGDLEELLREEEAGADRKGVKSYIEARIEGE